MNKSFLVIFACCCVSSGMASNGHFNDSTKAEIKEVEQLLVVLDKALVDRNFDVLDKHYAADLKLIAPNGMILTREQLLMPFKDPNKKSALRKAETAVIEMTLGKNYAYLVVEMIHSFEGRDPSKYENVLVFSKTNGTWQMKLSHASFLKD